ncbi:hypothetical protein KEM55_004427 [Ascosphaera atra]|nr:hypothetical protein KEM55_004427 [Ascosphaera atra]
MEKIKKGPQHTEQQPAFTEDVSPHRKPKQKTKPARGLSANHDQTRRNESFGLTGSVPTSPINHFPRLVEVTMATAVPAPPELGAILKAVSYLEILAQQMRDFVKQTEENTCRTEVCMSAMRDMQCRQLVLLELQLEKKATEAEKLRAERDEMPPAEQGDDDAAVMPSTEQGEDGAVVVAAREEVAGL